MEANVVEGRSVKVSLRLEPALTTSGASKSYRQQFTFGDGINDYHDPSFDPIQDEDHSGSLYVVTAELFNGRMEESAYVFSASYEISGVWSRGPNEFFVLGRSLRDAAIMERWTLRWPDGAPAVRLLRQSADTVGTPVGDGLVVVGGIEGGGVHQAPGGRRAPRMVRKLIYAGSDYGAVQSMSPDLQGRYLVALFDVDSTVLQFVLANPVYSLLLADEVSHPFLADCRAVQAFADNDQGRGVYVGSGGQLVANEALFLWDFSNDSAFESEEILLDDWAYFAEDSSVDWNYDVTALGYDF